MAFIFDLDGVLVDSNPVHTLAWQIPLAPFGSDIERRMPGKHNADIVRGLFGPLGEEETAFHDAEKGMPPESWPEVLATRGHKIDVGY
jgi:beta-phosphoglucomutase-like phosphatase (HAD superfamily)